MRWAHNLSPSHRYRMAGHEPEGKGRRGHSSLRCSSPAFAQRDTPHGQEAVGAKIWLPAGIAGSHSGQVRRLGSPRLKVSASFDHGRAGYSRSWWRHSGDERRNVQSRIPSPFQLDQLLNVFRLRIAHEKSINPDLLVLYVAEFRIVDRCHRTEIPNSWNLRRYSGITRQT